MRTCKICNVEKQYVLKGVTEGRNFVYIDANGGQWHGRTCYDCFKGKLRTGYVKRNHTPKACVMCGEMFAPKRHTARMCSKKCMNKKTRQDV